VSVYNNIFMTKLGWTDFTTQMILSVQIYPTKKKKKKVFSCMVKNGRCIIFIMVCDSSRPLVSACAYKGEGYDNQIISRTPRRKETSFY
jgi:hypothetical protein